MNGFTNATLSVLLGWLKSLFNAIWRLLNSEGGGSLFQLLRENWKALFLVLCIGGFVVDRLVYFFRWRPYYVWGAKLGRLSRRRERPEAPAREPAANLRFARGYDPEPTNGPIDDAELFAPPPVMNQPYTPQGTAVYQPAAAPQATAIYQPVHEWSDPSQPAFTGEPLTFAPIGGAPPLPAEDEGDWTDAPRFDEEPDWAEQDATRVGMPMFAPPGARYGDARPEPPSYFEDVQNGFAPPPTPEELYRRRSGPILSEPVHPGLDLETFRENVGLSEGASESVRAPQAVPVEFAPFAAVETEPQSKPKGGLSALAKKARTLVGGVDDENPPSIRDLQSTVDLKSAFHAPVYPKRAQEESEDE